MAGFYGGPRVRFWFEPSVALIYIKTYIKFLLSILRQDIYLRRTDLLIREES